MCNYCCFFAVKSIINCICVKDTIFNNSKQQWFIDATEFKCYIVFTDLCIFYSEVSKLLAVKSF